MLSACRFQAGHVLAVQGRQLAFEVGRLASAHVRPRRMSKLAHLKAVSCGDAGLGKVLEGLFAKSQQVDRPEQRDFAEEVSLGASLERDVRDLGGLCTAGLALRQRRHCRMPKHGLRGRFDAEHRGDPPDQVAVIVAHHRSDAIEDVRSHLKVGGGQVLRSGPDVEVAFPGRRA